MCRAALRPLLIDPASFTSLRVVSGALMLGVLARARPAPRSAAAPVVSWAAAAALFAYAIAFSFAYLRLEAGAGALILFGAVQLTMNGWALARGHAPHALEWLGLAVAAAGLLLLTAPGLGAPDPRGFLLMALAGAAWGVYSLLGKDAGDPVAANASRFLLAAPLALGVSLLAPSPHLTPAGFALAVASGAVTSGLGYAVWYAALRGLTAPRAAIVQLAVPVLAALGGVAFLGERATLRLAVAGGLVLGGIALAVLGRAPARAG